MSLKFVIGPSGSGKSTTVYQEIIRRASKDLRKRFFIIVPDQFTMQTQKVLCEMSPSGGIMNIEVLSIGRLSHRIFEELGMDKRTKLDDTGKNLIVRKVALEHEDELSVVTANIKKVGYVAQIKSVISEFAQYGIKPEDLSEYFVEAAGKGNLTAKLRDLQIIYKGYQEYVKDRYITVEENIDLLVQSIPNSKLIPNSVFVFDGFTGFTPIQEQLLRELMLYTEQVIVTLLGDDKECLASEVKEQNLFYLTAKTYHRLDAIAKANHVSRDEDEVICSAFKRYQNNEVLNHLERSLFRGKIAKNITIGEDQALSVVSCENAREEVEHVCLAIRKMIREDSLSYRDFAVITGDLTTYGLILKEVFEEHDIPIFLDQKRSLLYHPYVLFLNSLLKVCTSGFSYESVMTLLRSGYLSVSENDIDLFDCYILKYGIRGANKYKQLFAFDDAAFDTVNQIRELVYQVVSPLLTCKKNAIAYTDALIQISEENGIDEKLLFQSEMFEKEGLHTKANEYEKVYESVDELFSQIKELISDEMSLEDYCEILKAGFAELKMGFIPQSVDQVVAGDLERTRLKPIKVLFIVGANDGIIPGNGGSGGFLSDLERNILQDMRMELAPTKRQKSFEERIYLYLNMTQPKEKLIISYSLVDSKGGVVLPSYLIKVICNLYTNLSVQGFSEFKNAYLRESVSGGKILLSNYLRDYVAGIIKPGTDSFDELLYLCSKLAKEPGFDEILSGAFYIYEPKSLSESIAKALFGDVLKTSISRLEKFSACAYSHFIKYGLSLKEEDEYGFEASDLGNLYHEVLCEFGNSVENGDISWIHFTDEEIEKFIDSKVEQFTLQFRNTVLTDTKRNEAFKERTKGILGTTLRNLSYHIQKGLYEPKFCELPFELAGDPTIYGKIDRLDLAMVQDDVYVKILDYKSGAHSFDPGRLFLGLDLQLAVYMNGGVQKVKKDYPDKNVLPAAILYYQIEDPMVKSQKDLSEEELEALIRTELRVNGLIMDKAEVIHSLDQDFEKSSDVIPVQKNKDLSLSKSSKTLSELQFDLIGQYAAYKVKEIGEQIKSGEININPYSDGDRTSCDYCSYRSICQYEEKTPGFVLRDSKLGKDEAFAAMEEVLNQAEDDKKHRNVNTK